MKKYIALIIISLILLTLYFSCAGSKVKPFPNINFEPTNPSDVEIIFSEEKPKKSYIKIGTVEARGGMVLSWKKLENFLRKKAAKIGGDAVIILKRGARLESIEGGWEKYLDGIVIKWRKYRNE